MPAHIHPVMVTAQNLATDTDADLSTASGSVYARDTNITPFDSTPSANGGTFQAQLSMSNQGGNQPIGIQRPMLGLNYIICQYGVFPARN